MVLIMGTIVTLMVVFYFAMLTSRYVQPPLAVIAIPIKIQDESPTGVALDFEPPGVQELPDVPEPQLADAIEAVTQLPTQTPAAIEEVNGRLKETGKGNGRGNSSTGGDRVGPKDGPQYLPDGQRWAINFTFDQATYKAYLDHYQIELAAFARRGTNTIQYVSQLTAEQPSSRIGFRRDEKRVFFVYPSGSRLQSWDDQLLRSAGVAIEDKIRAQFFPNAIRKTLLKLESQALNGQSLSTVRKTSFTCRFQEGRFQFQVSSIKTK